MSDVASPNPNPPPVLQLGAPLPGPTPEKLAAQSRFATRMWCFFIFINTASMLAVGLYLTPKAQGYNTHTELGLPPCEFFVRTGIPCPTCGCTTAVSNFAHGHIITSFITQPFGFLVALIAAFLVPLSAIGITTGKWRGPSTFWLAWHWQWWTYGGMAYLALAWLFKILMVKMGY